MSDTPRTDEFAREARKGDSFKAHIMKLEDFARQLEREVQSLERKVKALMERNARLRRTIRNTAIL